MSDRGLDLVPDSGRGSTEPTIWFSDAELVLPRLDHRREVLVDGHHGLDLRALVGIERAEGIFRGERDMVFAVGHHLKSKISNPNLKVQGTP